MTTLETHKKKVPDKWFYLLMESITQICLTDERMSLELQNRILFLELINLNQPFNSCSIICQLEMSNLTI